MSVINNNYTEMHGQRSIKKYNVSTAKEQQTFRREVIYSSSDLMDRSTTCIRKVGNLTFRHYDLSLMA